METPHLNTWIKSIEIKKEKGFCSELEKDRLIEFKEIKQALSMPDVGQSLPNNRCSCFRKNAYKQC